MDAVVDGAAAVGHRAGRAAGPVGRWRRAVAGHVRGEHLAVLAGEQRAGARRVQRPRGVVLVLLAGVRARV